MWVEGFLEKASVGRARECNSSWVKKMLLNISKLLMLVELLLGHTKVHWKLAKVKHLELWVQRKKQNCFALLQGGEGPTPECQSLERWVSKPSSRVLTPFTAKWFLWSCEGESEERLSRSNCGLLKYLNLKNFLRFWCTLEIRCMHLELLFWVYNSFLVTEISWLKILSKVKNDF